MILITGGTGFVGRHLVPRLTQIYKVRCLVRKSSKKQLTDCHMIQGDLLDYDSLLLATRDIDIVIHLAAAINSRDPQYLYNVNVNGAQNLINACIKNRVSKFIFVSSAAVSFSRDVYSACKLEVEDILKKSNLNSIVLRPTEIYGPGDTKGITKLIDLIRAFPIIPVLGKGDYTLQPVHVQDVISVIMYCVTSIFKNHTTYNIAGTDILTFNEVIDVISEVLNVKRFKIYFPIRLVQNFVYIQEKFLTKPFIYSSQIQRISTPFKKWDIQNTIKDFNFTPLSFKSGIQKTVAEISK